MYINKKDVGARIKSIRSSRGMTLEEFGKIFGASKGNAATWEKGSSLPNNERLLKIAEIGGISVDELLYGDKRLYIKNVIKADLERDVYNSWRDYIDKYKDVIINNVIEDLENSSAIHNLTYDELNNYAISGTQAYILAALKDTEDMLVFLTGELNRLQSRVKIYIGEAQKEKQLKVNEIDIEIAKKAIEYLDETIEKISNLIS